MVEKARQARLLREEAGDCHDRFVGSGGEALDQLECFAEKHRQTTEIYSLEESPDSYLNYARALRFLGNYHRLRALEHAKVMEEASSRSSVLAEKRREASEKARHYYRRSNEVFDRYFTVRPGGIAYLWASQNSEALEDYDKALRYLERYARSIESPTAEQVQALEDYRKRLEKLLEAETLEREQGRSGR